MASRDSRPCDWIPPIRGGMTAYVDGIALRDPPHPCAATQVFGAFLFLEAQSRVPEESRVLDRLGCYVDGAVDHGVSWSLYLCDPEGNQVELFADNPAVDWRRSSEWVNAPSLPFVLTSKDT